jgi:hypothetical protein
MLFDQCQQAPVEQSEDLMGKTVAGLREGLSADFAPQVGAVLQTDVSGFKKREE